MKIVLNDELFTSKQSILDRCRKIRDATPDGRPVDPKHMPFLLALFKHHDGWHLKAPNGVVSITTQTNPRFNDRCFVLVPPDRPRVDISFLYTIQHCLSAAASQAERLPHALTCFRLAARDAIREDIVAFRGTCRDCEVDHVAPNTFDALLFKFCVHYDIDPLCVSVGSRNGVEPFFESATLRTEWVRWHQERAVLRALSKAEHRALKKPAQLPWRDLFTGLHEGLIK